MKHKPKHDLTVYVRSRDGIPEQPVIYRKWKPTYKNTESLLDLVEFETGFTICQNLNMPDFFDVGAIDGDNTLPIALTRNQLRQLAQELIDLSESKPE